MKYKLFFLAILSFFLLSSCNKDKITLEIVSPADNAEFSIYDEINVIVTATTKKGTINQVQLYVDRIETISLTTKPFNFIIPERTFPKAGEYYLSVIAYSSEGVQEGTAINIIIKE